MRDTTFDDVSGTSDQHRMKMKAFPRANQTGGTEGLKKKKYCLFPSGISRSPSGSSKHASISSIHPKHYGGTR